MKVFYVTLSQTFVNKNNYPKVNCCWFHQKGCVRIILTLPTVMPLVSLATNYVIGRQQKLKQQFGTKNIYLKYCIWLFYQNGYYRGLHLVHRFECSLRIRFCQKDLLPMLVLQTVYTFCEQNLSFKLQTHQIRIKKWGSSDLIYCNYMIFNSYYAYINFVPTIFLQMKSIETLYVRSVK